MTELFAFSVFFIFPVFRGFSRLCFGLLPSFSFFFGFLHMVNLNLCLVPSFKMLMVMKVVRSPGMLAIIGLGGNLHILGHMVRVKFAYSGAWV